MKVNIQELFDDWKEEELQLDSDADLSAIRAKNDAQNQTKWKAQTSSASCTDRGSCHFAAGRRYRSGILRHEH